MLTPAELHALQRELAGTNVLSVYLDTGATDPAMRESWRLTLQSVVREAHSHIDDTQERDEFDRAAALDLLLVTPRFVGTHEREAEDFARDAIASGADVEVPSGEAAERLDRAADGVAARLRFPIDEPRTAGDAMSGG